MREVRRPVLLAEIGKPCSYCGLPMDAPTRDHIHPRRLGGTLDEPNRAFTCDPCNSDKADMSLADWLAELRSAGDPRAPIVAAFVRARA